MARFNRLAFSMGFAAVLVLACIISVGAVVWLKREIRWTPYFSPLYSSIFDIYMNVCRADRNKESQNTQPYIVFAHIISIQFVLTLSSFIFLTVIFASVLRLTCSHQSTYPLHYRSLSVSVSAYHCKCVRMFFFLTTLFFLLFLAKPRVPCAQYLTNSRHISEGQPIIHYYCDLIMKIYTQSYYGYII